MWGFERQLELKIDNCGNRLAGKEQVDHHVDDDHGDGTFADSTAQDCKLTKADTSREGNGSCGRRTSGWIDVFSNKSRVPVASTQLSPPTTV